MAVEDTEVPWDERTDTFITMIDGLYAGSGKGAVGIRQILLNGGDLLLKKETPELIGELRKNASNYFGMMRTNLASEEKELEQLLMDADLFYKKIDSVVSSKAAAARVPYMKPYFVYLDSQSREEMIVEKYTEDMDPLIGRLVNASDYVADLSGNYKGHRFGSWFFSGKKSYAITLRVPDSLALDMERSATAIDDMLNAALESSNSMQQQPKK